MIDLQRGQLVCYIDTTGFKVLCRVVKHSPYGWVLRYVGGLQGPPGTYTIPDTETARIKPLHTCH
jgi:hypothetical protein